MCIKQTLSWSWSPSWLTQLVEDLAKKLNLSISPSLSGWAKANLI